MNLFYNEFIDCLETDKLDNPENTFAVNFGGTKNVVDFCIASNCELHHISTISVSGQVSISPYKFTSPIINITLYMFLFNK